MKQKDIALIIVVAFVSAVLSMLLSNMLLSGPKNRQMTAEVVNPISDKFEEPNKKYFNENSVNPTKLIRIGDNTNNNPFKSN